MVLAENDHYNRSTQFLVLFAERVKIIVRNIKPEKVKFKAQNNFNSRNRRRGNYYFPEVKEKGMEAWLRHNKTNYDQIWKENNLKWFSNDQQLKVRDVLHKRVKTILVDRGLLLVNP